MKNFLFTAALALVVTGGPAFADDGDVPGLDETMRLMPQDATLPDVVTAAIELPKDEEGAHIPNKAAVEHSAHGLETANAAREDGRAFGEAMAAAARENRENVTRSSRPDLEDLLPDRVPGPPDAPDPPDVPDPPTPPDR